MKKIIAVSALAAMLALSFAGCGEEKVVNVSTETKPAATQSVTTATQPATAASQSASEEYNTVAPYQETTAASYEGEQTTAAQEDNTVGYEQIETTEAQANVPSNYSEDQAVSTVMSVFGYDTENYTGYYAGSLDLYGDGVIWHLVSVTSNDGSLTTTYYINDLTGEVRNAY